jgi:hypothetical protein
VILHVVAGILWGLILLTAASIGIFLALWVDNWHKTRQETKAVIRRAMEINRERRNQRLDRLWARYGFAFEADAARQDEPRWPGETP